MKQIIKNKIQKLLSNIDKSCEFLDDAKIGNYVYIKDILNLSDIDAKYINDNIYPLIVENQYDVLFCTNEDFEKIKNDYERN